MRKVLSGFIICLFIMNLGNAQDTAGQGKLEVVASLDKAQPIGVSVSSTNRVFVSFPHREPYLFGLTEIVEGKMKPYPNH